MNKILLVCAIFSVSTPALSKVVYPPNESSLPGKCESQNWYLVMKRRAEAYGDLVTSLARERGIDVVSTHVSISRVQTSKLPMLGRGTFFQIGAHMIINATLRNGSALSAIFQSDDETKPVFGFYPGFRLKALTVNNTKAGRQCRIWIQAREIDVKDVGDNGTPNNFAISLAHPEYNR